ncbi:Fungalysin metallopeptidase-domain-containing protein [Syncephalis plumigaleata]|nr:Fungalysin metallopeptidase-domain-containing protein [Syncephalis plumigaleata]
MGKPLPATNVPLSPTSKADSLDRRIEPMSITPVAVFATIVNSPELAKISASLASPGNPGVAARNLVTKHLGVTGAVVETEYVSALTKTTHVYFKQYINDIEVTNGDIGVTVADTGLIVTYSDVSYKASGPNKGTLTPWPQSTPQQMQAAQLVLLSTVAQHLGLPVSPPPANLAIEPQRRADKSASFVIKNVPYAAKPIVTRQVYIINKERNAIPAWQVDVQYKFHRLIIHVTADGKAVLALADGLFSATYGAVPLGYSDVKSSGALLPYENPHDPRVSPNGWHWLNGRITQTTEGSNAKVGIKEGAVEGQIRTISHPSNDYIYDFNPKGSIQANERAAVSNAFYLVNTMHDINANYGFGPMAGNFESGTGTHPGGTPKNDRIVVTLQDPDFKNNVMFFQHRTAAIRNAVGLYNTEHVYDFALTMI